MLDAMNRQASGGCARKSFDRRNFSGQYLDAGLLLEDQA